MKGDFSRLTFDRKKHYSDVLLQQGRVLLDADWNEQQRITRYRAETETADAIGPSGVPAAGGLSIHTASHARNLSVVKSDDGKSLLGWIVGDHGLILHWDGQAMKSQRPPEDLKSTLRSVCFVDEKTGWAAGDKGVILFTANGGATWARQASKTDYHLLSICFLKWGKTHVGCAVGVKGTLLYSLDGGKHWIQRATGTLAQLNAAHVLALDNHKLKFFAAGNQRTILEYLWNDRTKKLTAAAVVFNDPDNAKSNLYAINTAFFNNQESGCAVGAKGAIFYKKDQQWNVQSSGLTSSLRAVEALRTQPGSDPVFSPLWAQILGEIPILWAAIAEDGRILLKDHTDRWLIYNCAIAGEKVRAANLIDLGRDARPGIMTILSDRGAIFNQTDTGWQYFTRLITKMTTSPGRIYIDGVLSEFEQSAELPLPADAGEYLAYIECHRRHISALQDPSIRETALGGPDTCTRLQTIAQVKYLAIKSAAVTRKMDRLRTDARRIAQDISLSLSQKNAAGGAPSIQQATDAMKKASLMDNATMKVTFGAGSQAVKKFVEAQKNTIGPSAMEKVQDKFDAWEKAQTDLVELAGANSVEAAWTKLTAERTCALCARVTETETQTNLCKMVSGGGYSGLENQLYRVEIHESGALKDGPTFKWSRDNGSVAFPFEFVTVNDKKTFIRLPASSPGSYYPISKEEWIGTWVEVIDDKREGAGEPGLLMQIADVPSEHEMVLDGSLNASDWSDSSVHPLIRRWDSKDAAKKTGALPVVEEGWIELESGVQIRFEKGGDYRTGDYWMIPARTDTADVEWPRQGGEPLPMPPKGICRHYAPLALLTAYDTGKNDNDIVITEFSDCRAVFEPQAKNALHVIGINWQNDGRLAYNALNLLNVMTAGFQITLDDAPEAWSVHPNSIVVEMGETNAPLRPFPADFCDIRVNGNVITWRPAWEYYQFFMSSAETKKAGVTNINEMFNAAHLTNPSHNPSVAPELSVITLLQIRITLKGHLICKRCADHLIYLDGQAFGRPREDRDAEGNTAIRCDLSFPSGSGNKASNFEGWLSFVTTTGASGTNKSVSGKTVKTAAKRTPRKKTGK